MKQMKKIQEIVVIAILLLLITGASATSVDRLSMCNSEGYPGDTITENVQLTGTSPDRIGHWRTSYKHIEGDEEARVDIRSWITITPENYTLKPGEVKTFTVEITIPDDAEPGLYGAISTEACLEGHSDERRTYIIFEDANATAAIEAQGSVAYSGLLLPIFVNVLGKANPLAPFIEMVQANIIILALLTIITVLLVLLLRRK
jgi:hypothetical protein